MGGICRLPFCFFFLSFFPAIFPLFLDHLIFLTCFLNHPPRPPPHLMIYSPNVSWPDPEMVFLFARIWSFLLCLTQNITPSQTKHVVFFPPLPIYEALCLLSKCCLPTMGCFEETCDFDVGKKYDPPRASLGEF